MPTRRADNPRAGAPGRLSCCQSGGSVREIRLADDRELLRQSYQHLGCCCDLRCRPMSNRASTAGCPQTGSLLMSVAWSVFTFGGNSGFRREAARTSRPRLADSSSCRHRYGARRECRCGYCSVAHVSQRSRLDCGKSLDDALVKTLHFPCRRSLIPSGDPFESKVLVAPDKVRTPDRQGTRCGR